MMVMSCLHYVLCKAAHLFPGLKVTRIFIISVIIDQNSRQRNQHRPMGHENIFYCFLSPKYRKFRSEMMNTIETKSEGRCVESDCNLMGAVEEKNKSAGRLTHCENHNVCARCGKTSAWSHLICRYCDPTNRCIEIGCMNLRASKMKGSMPKSWGDTMICIDVESLARCATHNICIKCGTSTYWDDSICFDCRLTK